MKVIINVTKEQEVDLSEEDCERILIKTLYKDWYSGFDKVMADVDKEAFRRVYYVYSGKHLV